MCSVIVAVTITMSAIDMSCMEILQLLQAGVVSWLIIALCVGYNDVRTFSRFLITWRHAENGLPEDAHRDHEWYIKNKQAGIDKWNKYAVVMPAYILLTIGILQLCGRLFYWLYGC